MGQIEWICKDCNTKGVVINDKGAWKVLADILEAHKKKSPHCIHKPQISTEPRESSVVRQNVVCIK